MPLVLIVLAIGVAYLLAKKNVNSSDATSSIVTGSAILWAHKTAAGFVCAGYAVDVDKSSVEADQFRLGQPVLIDPHLINPGLSGEPKSPGYGRSDDIYVSSSELEEVADGAGVYQVLMPLIAGGILSSNPIVNMMATDTKGRDTIKTFDSKQPKKNVSVGRTYPFHASKLYLTRSYSSSLVNYGFPVLLELSDSLLGGK